MSLATQQQLREEWLAIVRSHAFGLPFLHWIASFADMDYPGFPIPCAAWVFEAYQLAKHFLECTLQENAKVQKAKGAFSRADRLANDKQTFAAVRGPGAPPVLQTCTHVAFPVIVVTRDGGFLHDVFADVSDLSKLSGAFPILLGDHPSGLVEVADHFITVSTVSSLDLTDQVVSLTQDQYATAPDEVAADLTQFWQAIWHKQDPPAPFAHAQPGEFGLDEILRHVPHQEDTDIDLNDLDVWKSAIQKLRSASARGSDGISAQELKLLPDCAIAALARILAQDGFQFDQHFVVGLVAPLSKAGLQIPSRDKTRPITILPQLYRLWSSVVSQQIAASLNKWAPRQITGFLPGRGSVQAALSAQFDLEEARATGAFLTGLVLDFTKCFNNISWILASLHFVLVGSQSPFLRSGLLPNVRFGGFGFFRESSSLLVFRVGDSLKVINSASWSCLLSLLLGFFTSRVLAFFLLAYLSYL